MAVESVGLAIAAMDGPLQELAQQWAKSPYRPRPTEDTVRIWNELIEEWIISDLPIICRTPNYGRGSEKAHSTGRILTFADNTPAHWSMGLALNGIVPNLMEIRGMFGAAGFPLAFALKQTEKLRLKYTRGGPGAALRLNKAGWKVCHIAAAGLRFAGNPTTAPIEAIENHFRRFRSPGNMFLIPLKLGGLGETPQMIEALRSPSTR